jgi:hypothetical protein
MMNEFLPQNWVERVERLALGLEPVDAARGTRMAQPFDIVFDEAAQGLPRPRIRRHNSCLFILLYESDLPALPTRVKLRFLERARDLRLGPSDFARRFVPRLISFPLKAVAAAEQQKISDRIRRPWLFPGAAYEVCVTATGLRGRVSRNGQPARWARIVATQRGNGTVVGRAHGDDRGEFLLLISPEGSGIGDLPASLALTINVMCRAVAPAQSTQAPDPFWDLPEEVALDPLPGNPFIDPVAKGDTLPASFTPPTSTDIDLPLGRITSRSAVFVIP